MKVQHLVLTLILVAGIVLSSPSAAARIEASSADDPGRRVPSVHGEVSMAGDSPFWTHWTTSVNISQSPVDEATWPACSVSAVGEWLYVAWSDGRDGAQNIYYAMSPNSGDNWSISQRVWNSAYASLRPNVVLLGSNLLLTWADETSPGRHTTYQMTLGATPPSLVPNTQTSLAYASHLVVGPNNELHLVMQGGDPEAAGSASLPDILYTRRSASATTWPAAAVVHHHQATGSYHPDMAVGTDRKVYLLWEEKIGTASQISYMSGQRSGENTVWSTPISISGVVTKSVRPTILLGSGTNVYAAWGEQTTAGGPQYVRFARSQNGGGSWSSPTRVDPAPVYANGILPTDVAPALVQTPSGALCVAWHGFRSGASAEAEEIYVTCSTNQGTSWAAPINVSRSPSIVSVRPVMTVGADGTLHLAWQEYTPGGANSVMYNYEIHYAHNIPYTVHLPLIMRESHR